MIDLGSDGQPVRRSVTECWTPTCRCATPAPSPFSLSWALVCFRRTGEIGKKASVFALLACQPYLTRESCSSTFCLCPKCIHKTCFTPWDPKICKAWFPDACRSMGYTESLVYFCSVVIFLHKLYKKNKSSTAPEQILFLVTYDTLQLSLVTCCLAVLLCKCRERC